MKTAIISAVALACIAHALPQGGPPVGPPTTTTPGTGPPTNPPGEGGGGGGGGHGGGRRGDRFALILEVVGWDDMNNRFLRPELDSNKGLSYLTPNINGESVNRRFAFEALSDGNSFGNVGYKAERNSPAQWTGIYNTDHSNCQLGNSPIFVASSDTNSSLMWWMNDGTWTAPGTPTGPPTGPPVGPPATGPVDGAYWQRQLDWHDDRHCHRGPPGGGDSNQPQDKFAICWVKIPDPVNPRRMNDRLALHWHNTKMDDIDKRACWPARVKMGTWKGPGGGN